MSGIRINNTSLESRTFDQARNFKLLIDEISEDEARTILVKLLGNCLIEGSADGTNWHSITSSDTSFRVSSDGGSNWVLTDLNLLYRYYFKNGVPYVDETDVYNTIPLASRFPYLTVNINGVEYWFTDVNTLANKAQSIAIADNSITLVKLVNVSSGAVYFRSDAGNGPIQAVPFSTLMAAMNLSGTNSGDETAESILLLLGVNDVVQSSDLAGYIPVTAGYGLISDTDLLNLQGAPLVETITLPSGSTVANRIAGATSGVDYPSTWTLVASGIDLVINHSLNRRIVSVTVFSDSLSIERQLFGNAAYSGIYQSHTTEYNQVTIESLATIETNIVIELVFSKLVNPITIVPQTVPTVETYGPSNITTSSFETGGTVTSDGNSAVTSRGICWGLIDQPTILNDFQESGSGVGFFYNNIIDLFPGFIYYYRAYATNAVGTSYGQEMTLTTYSS